MLVRLGSVRQREQGQGQGPLESEVVSMTASHVCTGDSAHCDAHIAPSGGLGMQAEQHRVSGRQQLLAGGLAPRLQLNNTGTMSGSQ